MSRIKITSLGTLLLFTTLLRLPALETNEDIELRDLDVTKWECGLEGTAQSEDTKERNRMKNRWPVNLSLFSIQPLDSAGFLSKVRDYDTRIRRKRRGELTARQKDELDKYENQIVSLTGWFLVAYAGPPETTNCASANFHDWHLELFASPSDHAPRIGDKTPIVCEITPRTEQRIYRDGVRIQSIAEFFRSKDISYHATGHNAQKLCVTGYLMWDDEHNGGADVGSSVEYFSANGFHHPWRATAWEIHPVMKVDVIH